MVGGSIPSPAPIFIGLMYYTIYKTTNLINGHYYIGKHQTLDPYDNYLGSGNKLKIAFKTYGKQNFSKEVLFIFDSEKEMNEKEKVLVTEELVKSKKCYNIGVGGQGGPLFKGKNHSEETIEKIKKNHRRLSPKEEHRNMIGDWKRGRLVTLETKIKILETKWKRVLTENEIENLKNGKSNWKPKHKKNIGKTLTKKGAIYMKNEVLQINKMVNREDVLYYENLGYVKGVIRKLKPCGTAASYDRGCRCEDCKKAYSENRKNWKSYKETLKK